ncbi:L-lactate permease [Moorellaceae bacterium AZ2]
MRGLPELQLWLWVVSLLPIIAVLVLMMIFRWSGGKSGVVGWLLTLVIAYLWFGGNLHVLSAGMLKGLWATVWVLYIIWGAMTVYNVVDLVGGFKVISDTFTRLTRGNKVLQLLVMGWAFPGFVQGVCGYGVPVATAAPILVGLGYEPIFAAATALIGHSWAVTFGSLGSSYSILVRLTTLDPGRLAFFASIFLGLACVMCGYSIAHMYGGWKTMKEYSSTILAMSLTMALVLFLVANFVTPYVASMVAGASGLLVGGLVVPRLYKSKSTELEAEVAASSELYNFHVAFAAYYILILIVFTVYLIAPLKQFLQNTWQIGFPFPETKTLLGFTNQAVKKYQSIPFFTAPGTLIFTSALLGYLYYRAKGLWPEKGGRLLVSRFIKQVMGATMTVVTMTMMGVVMMETGMTRYIAEGLAATGTLYPLFSPWIGVLGAFMTGSNTNSNVLFTGLQWDVAKLLMLSPYVILGLQTTGGAIGNMFCPMNVALGTGVTGQGGREGEVLRRTALYNTVQTFMVGILAWFILYVFFPGIE